MPCSLLIVLNYSRECPVLCTVSCLPWLRVLLEQFPGLRMQLAAYEDCARTFVMCTFVVNTALSYSRCQMWNTIAGGHFVRPTLLGGIDRSYCVRYSFVSNSLKTEASRVVWVLSSCLSLIVKRSSRRIGPQGSVRLVFRHHSRPLRRVQLPSFRHECRREKSECGTKVVAAA